jgi:hypothetical protein
MDTMLVVAVDARHADIKRIKLLNINVTTQAGTPISPNPIRPSFGAGVTSLNLGGEQIYFFPWPNRLAGDVNPTLALALIYTPPVPGQAWANLTLYPPGSVVVPNASPNGHYYVTYNGGMSGTTEPNWPVTQPIADNNCTWAPMGAATVPNGVQATAYKLGTQYAPMSIVFVPTTGQNYVQTNSAVAQCTSGATSPTWVSGASTVSENTAVTSGETTDASVQWSDTGTFNLPCNQSSTPPAWAPHTPYAATQRICNPAERGRIYSATVAGTSGDKLPHFARAGEAYLVSPAIWNDLGQVAPASVASPPSDQTITESWPLPQTHSLYFYNVSSGVFVSTIRVRTFGFAAGSSSTTNSGTPVQTGSTLLIDPVISLTRYIKGFDAERKWRSSDLFPAPTLSFSLSSPTSNFYIGASSEFQRYLQFNYGFAIAKTPKLASGVFNPATSTTPATTQTWSKGAYFGLSFNISGLIQGLSGGGGGKGGSSSGSSSSQ